GQPQLAEAFLRDARTAAARTDITGGPIIGRLNYVTALAQLQQGQAGAAATALKVALASKRTSSVRLFQLAIADESFLNGGVTSRVATELYELMLNDPPAASWAEDPYETLGMLLTPHRAAYDHWF